MPPIQWLKLRHMRVALDRSSTWETTLDPVVVNPDTISYIASTKRGISPLSIKGRQPNTLRSTQPRETVTNPSLAKNTDVSGFFLEKNSPSRTHSTATAR